MPAKRTLFREICELANSLPMLNISPVAASAGDTLMSSNWWYSKHLYFTLIHKLQPEPAVVSQ